MMTILRLPKKGRFALGNEQCSRPQTTVGYTVKPPKKGKNLEGFLLGCARDKPLSSSFSKELAIFSPNISSQIQRRRASSSHETSMDNFDSLKREATKLERSLEDKVARYQQLVQSVPGSGNDLLLAESGMSNSGEEEKMRHDIQRTIQALQDLITTQLSLAADRGGAPNAALLVKRYREILFDLSGDFEKARQAHVRKQERAQLMDGARTSINQFDDPAMELLMRERNHINNSMNAASSVIAQASEVRSDLRLQGMSLGRVQTAMGAIASNIPGLNTLVDKIRRKKTMDDKIVAGVIASCILFTLWYLFH